LTERDEKLKEELKKFDVKCYINDVLKEKGIQEIQLARRIGVSKQSMHKMISVTKENMTIETALKMSYALNVDINRIFTLE
jgi:hypothetical protein